MRLNIVTHSINYGQKVGETFNFDIRFATTVTDQKQTSRCSHLVEVAVQEAAGQVGRTLHQLEETHKVVAVERSERLHRKLHLRGVADLVPELLHLPADRAERMRTQCVCVCVCVRVYMFERGCCGFWVLYYVTA